MKPNAGGQLQGGKSLEHTLSVVAEGHLGLAKTNRVLAGAGAIVLLELSLFDVLWGEKVCVNLGVHAISEGEGEGQIRGVFLFFPSPG